MACQASSNLQLLTPAVSVQGFLLPRPPMRVNAPFDALPENEPQLLSIPEIRDDVNGSACSACGFLKPKIRVTKRKRIFNDMLLKMAGQGETKLDFSSCKQSSKAEDGGCARSEPREMASCERQRVQMTRRNSNTAVCAQKPW